MPTSRVRGVSIGIRSINWARDCRRACGAVTGEESLRTREATGIAGFVVSAVAAARAHLASRAAFLPGRSAYHPMEFIDNGDSGEQDVRDSQHKRRRGRR